MQGKAANMIVQSRDIPKTMRTICCARCTRPIEGDELFRVGRFTYGPCCILKVEEGK